MRKGLIATLGLVTVLTAFTVPTRASSQAPVVVQDSQAAVVVKDRMCGVLDGDGGFATSTDSMSVTTSSGVTMFTCRVKNVSNSRRESIVLNHESTGMSCGTMLGMTTDWREHISASGNAILTCRVK